MAFESVRNPHDTTFCDTRVRGDGLLNRALAIDQYLSRRLGACRFTGAKPVSRDVDDIVGP